MRDAAPQFKTAEYAGSAGRTCKVCGQAISGAFKLAPPLSAANAG
jgi:hypothetical protein